MSDGRSVVGESDFVLFFNEKEPPKRKYYSQTYSR